MQRTVIGCYIEFNAQFTGGPRVLFNLINRMDRDRFEPVVVTNKPSAMVDALKGIGVDPIIMQLPAVIGDGDGLTLSGGIGRKLAAWRALRQFNKRIYKVYQERGVKLVWVRGMKSVLLTHRAASKLGAPLVWDIGMERKSRGVMWLLYMLGFMKAARVVAEGDFVFRSVFTPWQLKRFGGKCISNMPGVADERIGEVERDAGQGPPPYDPFIVLNVASVNPRKNQMMLLKAVADLKDKHPGLRARFVGPVTDEAYQKEIDAFIAEQGLADRVELLGWRDDVADLLHQSHLFALTSHSEGVPQAVLEAAHAFVPVLSTAAGGIPEVVLDGQTGRLVEVGDQAGFTAALDDCLASPERLQAYAANAKAHVRANYMAEFWYKRNEAMFDELLGNPGGQTTDKVNSPALTGRHDQG